MIISGLTDRVVLQLRQGIFNVIEGDLSNTTYVLIDVDILINTLQETVVLNAIVSSKATSMFPNAHTINTVMH